MSAFVHQDPYLAWTVLTDFQGHAAVADSGESQIPLLIKANREQRAKVQELVKIPDAWPYRDSDFFTATGERNQLAAIEPLVDAMEFALPIAGRSAETKPLPKADPKEDPVIAVIDHGCAFLNAAFRKSDDRWKTRLVALWDQGRAATDLPWKCPAGFDYGRELEQDAINAMLKTLGPPPRKTESEIYHRLDYLLDDSNCVRETAHGTHVLDTAGGCVGPNPPLSSSKPRWVDPASSAPLIFVDVPSSAPEDTTGASTGAFLLDALRYIRHHAGEGVVVVNISLGAFAGPHDGTSLVEQAIDDFLDKDRKMVVTVAAGNAALARWHASGSFAKNAGGTVDLSWRTMPEDPTDSFLEVWFAAADAAGQADVRLKVTPPNGQETPWLPVGGGLNHEIRGPNGALIAAVLGRPKPSTGNGMFLVAVGPAAGPRRRWPPGSWRIALSNFTPGLEVRFDAWIQRDEPAWNVGPSVQSFFDWVSAGVTVGGRAGGLSSLATGRKTVVVGAVSAESGQPALYSSLGGRPRRGKGMRNIDFAAPADESRTAIGLLAAGVRSSTLTRMGGTSVAAPVAARRIYDEKVQPSATVAAMRTSGAGVREPGMGEPAQESWNEQVRKRLCDLKLKTATVPGPSGSLPIRVLSPKDVPKP